MKLKSFVDKIQGLRFVLEKMPLASGSAWRFLLEENIFEAEDKIQESYRKLDFFLHIDEKRHQMMIKHLCSLHDITNTLVNLQKGKVLDDIELYEIKHLAYISIKISEILNDYEIRNLNSAQKAFEILDPYKNKQDSFYVYDIYDDKLAEYRKRKQIEESIEEERVVLTILSSKLRIFSDNLQSLLKELLEIDFNQAKAVLYKTYHFTRPLFNQEGAIKIKGMYNPAVRERVGEQVYQPVDICLSKGLPSFLIGMNMGGKTVTLNTIILIQLLAQMGFGCPAEEIETEICSFLSGYNSDNNEKRNGYSSFANELLSLDEIITSSITQRQSRQPSLIVIDEPARTTNPTEGSALVKGLVKTLCNDETYLIVATHYNVQMDGCKYLRVKGLTKAGVDYHIEEVSNTEVPNEAISVAEMVKVSPLWINNSKQYLANAE